MKTKLSDTDRLIIISSKLPTLFLSGYEMLGDNFELNTWNKVD